MTGRNDLVLGVAIGGVVTVAIIAVWGVFSSTNGWARSDFINILVAIGTGSAAFGAFWGVRAVKKVQQEEWSRQDRLRTEEQLRHSQRRVAGTFNHFENAMETIWVVVQEIQMMVAQDIWARKTGKVANIQVTANAHTDIGENEVYSRIFANYLPSLEDEVSSADLKDGKVAEGFRRIRRDLIDVMRVLKTMEVKCRTMQKFFVGDIERLAAAGLAIALYLERVRVSAKLHQEQWPHLLSFARLVFPDYRSSKEVLSDDEIVELLTKISEQSFAKKKKWDVTKNTYDVPPD